ncbi:MAG: M20/M25/M40 family metallo-hydrolase [Gemmatimonas sp.]
MQLHMHRPSQIAAIFAALTLAAPVSMPAQANPGANVPAVPINASASTASVTFAKASLEWDAGRYPDALRQLDALLRSPAAADERERIALLTGENWYTTAVALNARAPRWSPDARWIAYESGTGNSRVTRIATVDNMASDSLRTVATLPGGLATFSPDGDWIAYVEGTSANGALVVRNLKNGSERTINDNGLQKAQLLFASNTALIVVGAPQASTRSDLWQISLNENSSVPRRLTSTDSLRAEAQLIPGTTMVLMGVGGRSPIGGATGNAFARGARTRFAVLDLSSGTERIFEGEAPAVSGNGQAATYITRTGGRNTLHLLPLQPLGAPQALHSSVDSLAAPALSPDGNRVAFQWQTGFDWDIYTVSRDGKAPVRVTRDVQHDLLPRFINNEQLIAMMGEARHRRAHLHDLTNHTQRRIFHNNTVRTIAPEYEWVPSPDGTKILIVAERDGDTVTPHRHLWMVDLARTVSIAELQQRVTAQRAAEATLRSEGARRFSPIAAKVREAVADVSTHRVYRHEKALFDFDSKHITRPGNLLAREYLLAQYTSFGLDARFQPFEARTNVSQAPVQTANVLAVLKGTENPELVYVVSSHFDSRAEGPGADDNTSGTAALLEAARVLSTRPQPATIIFASFTGEESGLLGSREFVRQAKADGLKFVGALNNDMLGWTNDNRLDNTIRYSNEGIRDLQHAAAIGFSNMITYDAFYYKSTDAAAFYDGYGDIVGGIGSYPVLGNPHYHQPHDLLEFENHQLIAEASKTTIASLMLLASSPSRIAGLVASKSAQGVFTATWNRSPEKGITKYLVRYGPAHNPTQFKLESVQPNVTLPNAKPGMTVQVKAVNRRGLEGWDWARFTIPQ